MVKEVPVKMKVKPTSLAASGAVLAKKVVTTVKPVVKNPYLKAK